MVKGLFIFFLGISVFSLGLNLPIFGPQAVRGTDFSFPDLEGHWAKEEVLSLSRYGIISGYPNGLFYPDKTVNLGEALKIVALSKGLIPNPLPGEHWAYPYFLSLLEEQVLPFDSFEPERKPSRGEIAEILGRAFYPEMEILSDPSFQDVPFDHPYFRSIEILHQMGIALGRAKGNFFPEETVSRAELSVLVCRILQLGEISVSQETPFGPLSLSLKPYRVQQGGFVKINLITPGDFSADIFLEGEKLKTEVPGYYLVPIPLDEETGPKEVVLIASSGEFSISLEANIIVAQNAIPSETIVLSEESIDLLSPELLAKEREEVYAALSVSSGTIPDFPFQAPINSPILSTFGAERVYPGWGSDYHWGVDLQGEEGDEVKAAGSGRVVMAKELYSRGNTIIIDHGSGLFTLYYHLSAFYIKEGDEIKKGETIGLVGSTGAVTGPHLHWEARLGKTPINPILLINQGGFR